MGRKRAKDSGEAIRYYHSFDEDVVESKKQSQELPKRYKWFHTNPLYRFAAWVLYGLAVVFGVIYSKAVLHIRVKNAGVLKKCGRSGCILYGNHTQPIGDAFDPAVWVWPKRIYTVAGTANLGIPFLGRLLPMLGALVTPRTFPEMKEFLNAMEHHLKNGRCVVIYPEAHVWPYCSFVRPFAQTAFRFPVSYRVPCFCMTMTYQKPEHFFMRFREKTPDSQPRTRRKPRITVYFDGPFYPDENANPKEEQRRLHDEVQKCMEARSRNSNYDYIRYERACEQ